MVHKDFKVTGHHIIHFWNALQGKRYDPDVVVILDQMRRHPDKKTYIISGLDAICGVCGESESQGCFSDFYQEQDDYYERFAARTMGMSVGETYTTKAFIEQLQKMKGWEVTLRYALSSLLCITGIYRNKYFRKLADLD